MKKIIALIIIAVFGTVGYILIRPLFVDDIVDEGFPEVATVEELLEKEGLIMPTKEEVEKMSDAEKQVFEEKIAKKMEDMPDIEVNEDMPGTDAQEAKKVEGQDTRNKEQVNNIAPVEESSLSGNTSNTETEPVPKVEPTPAPVETPEPAPTTKPEPAAEPAPKVEPTPVAEPEPTPEPVQPTGPVLAKQGSFRDADASHKGSGQATIFTQPDGSQFLRFENFSTTNGPDLKVWLVKGANGNVGTGYYSLGKLKGNKGNQNYTIPANVNIDEYNSVIIWCEAFSVLFSTATLN
jgi:hypothetical protein